MGSEGASFGNGGRFATTHWSLVLAAGAGVDPDARQALATLCETYWYPLYAFVRRLGKSPEDSGDLTQSFFALLLEKHYLRAADRHRGKFRSFLLAAFKHFLSKEKDRARAHKRGGGRTHFSLDFAAGENRYGLEPSHEMTPERLYERRWALTALDWVLARLRAEAVRAGKEASFDRLKGFLTGEGDMTSYRQAADELGSTEGAVKVAAHRLRRRFRELLLAEIAQTVAKPQDVGDELRHLFAALASPRS
jgi:DNA-directed RNA polymerase specialized sigma24 family protein